MDKSSERYFKVQDQDLKHLNHEMEVGFLKVNFSMREMERSYIKSDHSVFHPAKIHESIVREYIKALN
jgi:hypothetical protein